MRKMAGTLFNMNTAIGISRDKAFEMSTTLTKLAADMASFRNIGFEEAMEKIRSGLTGEVRALKDIGILVDDETVKQEAYAMGLAKTSEQLTQQEKVLARYSAIMRQTSNDQGDLARTIESPANQLRLFKTRVEEAATQLGMALMPFITQATHALNDYLVPALKAVTEWIGNLS